MKKSDLKTEFYKLVDSGDTQKNVAKKLGITETTATTWMRQRAKPLKQLEQAKDKLLLRLAKACDNPNSTHVELYNLSMSVTIMEKQIKAIKG
ncbi:hypothetical protein [Sphingobacterium siyangense]|uniref:hypothetical protein n=1 Tax=Sphingobacterium siyangense TaxID=459529 RepID=UPI003DA47700